MANITAADLLVGSDEDFVTNLYLASLGRWPDPGGFAHMVAKIAGSEAARVQAITDMVVSPEAIQRGRPIFVQDPLLPADPALAVQRQLALRTEFLLGMVEAMRTAPPALIVEVEPLLAEARADMAALRREMREGFAALRAMVTPHGAKPSQPEAAAPRRELSERQADGTGQAAGTQPGPDFADYVNDLLAVADARMELRLRALEKRLP